MFGIFRSLSVRYLCQHWDRALLIVFSIALGVGTLVSTRILTNYLDAGLQDTIAPLRIGDFTISNGEIGVRLELLRELREPPIEGIETLSPLLLDRVELPWLNPNITLHSARRKAVLIGVELEYSDLRTNLQGQAREGVRWELFPDFWKRLLLYPTQPKVLIGRAIYEDMQAKGLATDKPFPIRFAQQTTEVIALGVIDIDEGPAATLGRNVLGIELETATKVVGRPGQIDRIDVKLAPGADRATVIAALQQRLGNRAEVVTPEDEAKANDDLVGGLKLGFLACSFGAIVIGLFLVYNALSVSVAERRHDIGVMRSLGATRWQIGWLFTAEALSLGFAGALLGIPLGHWLADFALNLVKEEIQDVMFGDLQTATRLQGRSVLAALAAGMATALFAALVPAMQAAADEPADAVRRAPSSAGRWARLLHRLCCLVLIFGGIALVAFRHDLPHRIGSYGGMVCFLTGNLLAMPLYVAWMARLLQPLARNFLGVEARLAADNLLRSPGRTGVVIGALAAGVALMVQIAGVGRSNQEPVEDWLERGITADLFVLGGSLAGSTSSVDPMSSDIATQLKALTLDGNSDGPKAVETVVGLRFYRPKFRETIVFLIALDAQAYYEATMARASQPLAHLEAYTRLREPHTVLISDNFAYKHRVQVGDVLTIPGRAGTIDLKIVGLIQDYSWNKGTLVMDRKEYARLFEDDLVDSYHVFLRNDSHKPQAKAIVESAMSRQALFVQDREALRQYIAGVIRRIYQLAYMQQVIVGIVAALGVVTALLISVLQRRRELGLLRAVGATQGQVLKSVLAEAMLMGIIGTILGIAIGLPMEWYVLRIVLYEESGFFFEMLIPWREALSISLISVITAALAGLVPAIHAVRLRIAEAIAYE